MNDNKIHCRVDEDSDTALCGEDLTYTSMVTYLGPEHLLGTMKSFGQPVNGWWGDWCEHCATQATLKVVAERDALVAIGSGLAEMFVAKRFSDILACDMCGGTHDLKDLDEYADGKCLLLNAIEWATGRKIDYNDPSANGWLLNVEYQGIVVKQTEETIYD